MNTTKRPDDTWLYGWALGYAAVGAASLLVPLYAIDLGAGAFLVSLVAATAAFAGVPGAILWGRLVAKTHRRRPFILVALGLTGGVLLCTTFLSSPWTVLVANAMLWFVVAAAAPVLNLVVVAGYDPTEWPVRFGRLNEYQGYGWLAGLVAGGAWSAVAGAVFGVAPLPAKRLFFVASAVLALLGFLVVYVRYPERPSLSERRYVRLLRHVRQNGLVGGRSTRAVPFGPTRVYWAVRSLQSRDGLRSRLRGRFSGSLSRYLAAATLFFAGFAVFFAPLPAFLTDAGYGTGEVFALFVVSAAASAVSYARVGTLATHVDSLRLQTGALVSRAVLFPLVAVAGGVVAPPVGPVAVGVLFAAIGVSWAVIAVTATGLVTDFAPEPVRSEALGAYTALGSLGGGLGSAVGGVVAAALGYAAAFLLAAGCVLVAVLVVAREDRPVGSGL
ncbi:MFS transporter [Halogeometricum limi]|uniref:Major Facilitator Superfamily protein n=1 Tax=Halogeometricum limi TaxID=555875 RepID=A0A1I6GP13_9EURY|nr:MFS transporter [Halogeometricum limi]SFR43797.1 Major Facilitator Superfamily protein [Halogeometricum limi]